MREHPDAVEADLARWYGIDYRDRWRSPRLTLRRIGVLVRHLPSESACVALLNDDRRPWTLDQQLLDELRRYLAALGGEKNPKPDPGRRVNTTRIDTPERVRALTKARARQRERRRLIESGAIT